MNRDIPILLVEDDEVDVMTVQRAFKTHKMSNPLKVCMHGEDALAYLRREPPYTNLASEPMPGLILADLNMPVMNGIELLRELKLDESLKRIPVIVLTSSDQEQDLVESYALSVAGYIVKPVTFLEFVDVVRVLDIYWSMCRFPKE